MSEKTIEITDELVAAVGITDPENYSKTGLKNAVTKKLGTRTPEEVINAFNAKQEKKAAEINVDVKKLDEEDTVELLQKLGYKGSVDKDIIDLQLKLTQILNKRNLTVAKAEALEPEERTRKVSSELPHTVDFHAKDATAEPYGISAGLRDAALALEKAGFAVKTGRNFNRKPTQILVVPELKLRLEGGGLPLAYVITKE